MPVLGRKALIQVAPGVSPDTDFTELESITYVDSNRVRFLNGKLRKLGGWVRWFSTNFERLDGCIRSMYEYTPSDGFERTLIGTSSRLYVYYKGAFYNITPLETGTTAIADSLSTVYSTDSDYSVTTENGSFVVTFNIPHYLNIGDQVQISGVVGTIGGIGAASFNNIFTVVDTPSSSSFQVKVNTAATSNATGGGTGITFATRQILVSLNDHGLEKGDRIKITGASAVDGITAPEINQEHVVSAIVSEDVFAFTTDDMATSYVTGGGGAGALLQTQIAGGACDQSEGLGYGGGLYGAGLYGVPKEFDAAVQFPRIWSFDRWGDNVVLTPGDQQGVYIWANSPSVAPVLQTNAPLANWVYESNGVVVVLGPNGNNGTFSNSNFNNANDWTDTQTNVVSTNLVPGASKFISQAVSRDVDILFTEDKVYEVRYQGLPRIWYLRELFATDGIIGPKARVNIEDAVFWMGWGDFYVFDGTSVNILPNNTVKRYVYDNLNEAQNYKTFASAQPEFNEVWWYYPAGNDIEPNNYIIYNYKEQHWTIGRLERTAAAEPASGSTPVLLAQSHIVSSETLEDNPLSTNFYTLGTNPISTTNTSPSIVITIPAHHIMPGDSVQIAGATTTNGILAANINGVRPVTATTVNSITVTAGSNATSSGSGGGAAVTVGTSIVTINVDNSFSNDSDITLQSSSGIDSFTVANLNGTFDVRMWSSTAFDIAVPGVYSTTATTGGGVGIVMSYSRTGRLFEHNVGFDDYNDGCDINDPSTCVAPMDSYAETNYAQIGNGDITMLIYSVIPDSTQVGNMSITVSTKLYPQSSTVISKGPFTIGENTLKVDVMATGRQRKYRIGSNELGQNFIIGKWFEQVEEGTPI